MGKKSEIHALEFAVVEFLVELRLLLYPHTDTVKMALIDLDLARCGLKTITEKETDDSQDDMRVVTVHSLAWNDDRSLKIDFKKNETGWHARSGEIEGFRGFFKMFEWSGDEKIYFSCYTDPATGQYEKMIFETLCGKEKREYFKQRVQANP